MKRLLSAILCLVMLLSLCACGKKEEASAGPSARPKLEIGGTTKAVESNEYTFSEYLKNRTSIWYVLDSDKGKDSDIAIAYLIEENGDVYSGNLKDYTLGSLAQMEDSEIAEIIKAEYVEKVAYTGSDSYQVNDSDYFNSAIRTYVFGGLYNKIVCDYPTMTWEYYCENICNTRDLTNDSTYSMDAVKKQWDNIRSVYTTFYNLHTALAANEQNKNYFEIYYLDVVSNLTTGKSVEEVMNEVSTIDYTNCTDEMQAASQAAMLMDEVVKNIYLEVLAQIELGKTEVKPGTYAMTLHTDSTGNSTEKEYLVCKYNTPIGAMYSQMALEYYYPSTSGGVTTNCATVVYDSLYGGYRNDNYVFYTRVSDKVHFTLDEVSESEFPLDVERENWESLFN